jgi:N utilization substance protein B
VARRSEQRRRAVFALYQHDLTGRPLEDTLPRDAAPFTRALAEATLNHQPELDTLISHHAEGWALERIAPLERSILREGAIDEAIETAKAYCGSEAPGFVNGILAAVLREYRAKSVTHNREASA